MLPACSEVARLSALLVQRLIVLVFRRELLLKKLLDLFHTLLRVYVRLLELAQGIGA